MNAQPKPNFTAWFVMQGVIAAMRHPEFRDAANEATLALYQPLADAASRTRRLSRVICALPYAWQYKIGELVTYPGRLRHFYFRKKEIEKQARVLLGGKSVRQVIILGAGLDVLSLRLAPEYPQVQFIEIDMKESQEFKRASFAAYRVDLPGNVEFIAGDLRDPLARILANAKLYDGLANTLWIAEGFFMFIPQESVARILGEIKGLCAAESHVIFTSLPSYKATSPLRYMLQTLYLHKESSPYQWAMAFAEVPRFMQKLGYQSVFQLDYDSLQKNYLQQPLHSTEDIVENLHIVKT